jgi:hypothetical protein
MTPARARSLWLAASALLVSCSSSPNTQPSSPQSSPLVTEPIAVTPVVGTVAPTSAPTSSVVEPASTFVPVDPSILIPIALGNKPFPADADALASEHNGYRGDPNAYLQQWLITPMAVPSGPDVRLLGFERTVGINTTTATFLTGAIDPQTALTTIQTALAPSPTYVVTPSTRTEGTVTIFGFDATPTTVQGEPPGWTVEASAVDQLGIVRIKRSDYTFDKVVPSFEDMPTALQAEVLNQDAIAVTVGGSLTGIAYEYGVEALGESPRHRTRLTYSIIHDFAAATADLKARLTTGWTTSEQPDALNFTSTTTSEVWTLDEIGGATHLTYDTGS